MRENLGGSLLLQHSQPTQLSYVPPSFLKALYDGTYSGLEFPPSGKLGKLVKEFQSHGMCRNLKQGSVCVCPVDILVPNEVI